MRSYQMAGVGLFALVGAAAPVRAMDLLSFSFSDLTGVYDGSTLLSVADDGDSDGEISRLVAPVGDAFFFGNPVPGPGGFPGPAAFGMNMTIGGVTASTATGSGTLTFTDANGDTFSGTVNGNWSILAGSANFVGLLTGFVPNNSSGDGTFDGTDGSSFGMTFPAAPPYSGNIITLIAGNWFSNGAFNAPTTLAIGAITPEPGTLGLLLLGAAGLLRRRAAR